MSLYSPVLSPTITHRGTSRGINWFMAITEMGIKTVYLDVSDIPIFQKYKQSKGTDPFDFSEVDKLIPCIHCGCTYFDDHLPNRFISEKGVFIGWDYAHSGDLIGDCIENGQPKWQLGQAIELNLMSFMTKTKDEEILEDIKEVINFITQVFQVE